MQTLDHVDKASLRDDIPDEQRSMFIAMMRDDAGCASHCVGIDTGRRIIMDPSRQYALPLTRASFDMCVPDGHTFSGIAAARKLYRIPPP